MRWTKDGPVEKRARSVDPLYALTDAVIRWIEAEGGRFSRDSNGGAWLYFRQTLHTIDARSPQWRGWLYDIGRIIMTDRQGKAIASALEQYAQTRIAAPEPRPWIFFTRRTGDIAIHLHDSKDQIALCRRGGVEIIENAGAMLLHRDDATTPIDWPAHPDPAAAAELLDRLIVQNLASAEASLVVCWALSVFVRQALNTRALLFCGGAAGAGKTEAARLLTTLLHGRENFMHPTAAAAWAQGDRQPLMALDNQEQGQISGELQQWLLLAATGAQRKKRREGTTSGVVSQRTDAIVMVSAIDTPSLDELIQRTLVCVFEHRLHRSGYVAAAVTAEIEARRGDILAGVLALFSTQIVPRLAEAMDYAKRIPSAHPKHRLGHHLGVCALIADAFHAVRPGMWGTGAAELAAWLDSQGVRANAIAQGTDPIVAALHALLFCWNRVIPDMRDQGHLYRPAQSEQWFRCTAVFVGAEGHTTDSQAAVEHLDVGGPMARWGRVVGFLGSYGDLHADLLRAVRKSDGGDDFRRQIKTPSQLSARWQHNAAVRVDGWTATQKARSGRAGRRYMFVQTQRI